MTLGCHDTACTPDWRDRVARYSKAVTRVPVLRTLVSSCGSGFLFICRPKLALTGVGQPGGRAGV